MTIIRKILLLLSSSERKTFWWLLGLQVLCSITESLGFAMAIPYIFFLKDPHAVLSNPFFENIWMMLEWYPTTIEFAVGSTVALLCIIGLRLVFQVYVNYRISSFSCYVLKNQSMSLFQGYLDMDYRGFVSANSSQLIKNCTITTDQVATAMMSQLQMLSGVIVAICLSSILFMESFLLCSALVLTFGTLGLALQHFVKHRQMRSGMAREQAFSEMLHRANETLHSFKEVRLYNRKDFFSKHFEEAALRLSRGTEGCFFYPTLPTIFIDTLAIVALMALVLFFLWEGVALEILVGQVILLGLVGRRLVPSFNLVMANQVSLQRSEASLDVLHAELNRIAHFSKQQSVSTHVFKEAITFVGVGYHYQEDIPALLDINLTIRKGASVALVGPSGAGKSTLIELLISLLNPTQGHFILDGEPVTDLACLRHLIGYVPQQVNILDDSLARNIAFGAEEINYERLGQVVKMAHLQGVLSVLPDGFETVLGERGLRLSGGERQRVGIARALYFDPQIIIFDEATASLDQIAETSITENIREITGQRTVITVAHRISTIKDYDQIHVMNEGSVIASGTHDELLSHCTLYQKLNRITTNMGINQVEPANVSLVSV